MSKETALREFAEKYMVGTPYTLMYKKGQPHIVSNCFMSDLTALIDPLIASEVERVITERLREGLIGYIDWYIHKGAIDEDTTDEELIDEYLKSRIHE